MTDYKKFITDLNQTWLEHRYDDLYQYFHKDVVLLVPGSDETIVGIDPMVESYRQFGAIGTIHTFKFTELKLFDYHAVSICHARFMVDYEIETGRHQEQGMEIYAIEHTDPNAKIVWRTQVNLKINNA